MTDFKISQIVANMIELARHRRTAARGPQPKEGRFPNRPLAFGLPRVLDRLEQLMVKRQVGEHRFRYDQGRGLEDGTIPKHVLSEDTPEDGGRFVDRLEVKMWNGEWHGAWSEEETVGWSVCAGLVAKKSGTWDAVPWPGSRPGIFQERELRLDRQLGVRIEQNCTLAEQADAAQRGRRLPPPLPRPPASSSAHPLD